jgi:D-mannonate dehydratase
MTVARIPLSTPRVSDRKVAVRLAIHGLDPMSLVMEWVASIVTGIDALVRTMQVEDEPHHC